MRPILSNDHVSIQRRCSSELRGLTESSIEDEPLRRNSSCCFWTGTRTPSDSCPHRNGIISHIPAAGSSIVSTW